MPRALPAALLLLLVAVSHAAVTQVVVGAGFNKVFDPVDVNITVGDTIFWSWTGFFHNVVEVSNATTCNITGLVGGPKFCSINPSDPSSCTDAEWLNATNPPFSYNHTFTSPGTYYYICTVHCVKNAMRGSVTVLPPTTPPASTAPSSPTPAATTPAATTAAPTTPAGGTTAPPTTRPFVNYSDPYAMTSLMPQYDNCHVYNVNATVYANPVTPSAVLFWSVDTANNRIRFALNCYGRGKRIGFCAVGFKTGIIKAMLGDTDVNIGFWNGTAASMVDYHIGGQRPNPLNPAQDVCLGGNGVCSDAALGCADNVAFESAAVTFDGEKATFRWSRPLDSGDALCDRPLTAANSSVLVSARSYNPAAPALQFHDIFYSAYDSFSFVDAPDCPNNCSEVGTCNKGCCVCPPGTGGLDCSLGSIVRPIQLAALIAPGYYPFSHNIGRLHQQDKLTLHWTTYQLDGYYNNATAIELALEFRHDNPSDAWVAFGFGKEMRHSDVLIAQGTDLSLFGDYTIGTGKSCCGVGSSIEPDDSIGGQNSILSARSDYDTARGVWVIKYLRLLETGDPLDKKLSLGWNNFIWAVGRDSLLSKAGQHGKFNRWFGRFNIATGQLHNALDQRIIHGSLMFVAMAVLIPAGAALARYGKLKLKGVWFHGHRLIMLVALILEIAAFITVVQFVKPGSQFRTAHGRLGLVIIILSLAQPFLGWATDIFYNPNNTRPKPFPDLVHWITGWTVIVLVLAQCTLGLHDIGARTALHVLWDIYLILLVIALVGAALYFWFKYRYYGFRGGAIAVDDDDHK